MVKLWLFSVEGNLDMATKDYLCGLLRLRTRAFGADRWEEAGDLLTIPINFSSMPSRMNALLYAIEQYGGRDSIERYGLRVQDDDGNVFETLYATAKQLQLHNTGYPASVEDGTAPRSLDSFSDEQLIAELRRRLAARSADAEIPPPR
jgi:hypothetical protein